jgi:uncharacterized protein (TIGR00255 family)
MLYSMTGFSRLEFSLDEYQCSLEIRSLNGKQFEVSTKLPSLLKMYEIAIRSQLQQHLQRGSIDISIYLKQHGSAKPMTVNTELARYYYEAMNTLATELQLDKKDVLPTLMRMPEVVSSPNESLDERLWQQLSLRIDEACQQLNEHRRAEGLMLEKQIRGNVDKIMSLSREVNPHEGKRIEKLRERLQTLLSEVSPTAQPDQNRLEQEIVYYVERFDITEEKNRLHHHGEYFCSLLDNTDMVKGKKLGFLLQEMGREINTMGSKANDVDIQKLVVGMKDELEQAKEQTLNAL